MKLTTGRGVKELRPKCSFSRTFSDQASKTDGIHHPYSLLASHLVDPCYHCKTKCNLSNHCDTFLQDHQKETDKPQIFSLTITLQTFIAMIVIDDDKFSGIVRVIITFQSFWSCMQMIFFYLKRIYYNYPRNNFQRLI